jgi:hypothetical protein
MKQFTEIAEGIHGKVGDSIKVEYFHNYIMNLRILGVYHGDYGYCDVTQIDSWSDGKDEMFRFIIVPKNEPEGVEGTIYLLSLIGTEAGHSPAGKYSPEVDTAENGIISIFDIPNGTILLLAEPNIHVVA